MGLAGEQTIPIQNGRAETRQGHRYEDVMRLHEAAPKLIVQERVGDRMKISSYCPVALLTRAGLALGWLHLSPFPLPTYPALGESCLSVVVLLKPHCLVV